MSILKILVVGEIATGKSALVRRLVHNSFQENYKATIGCELAIKVIQTKDVAVKVQLWDLAGQERLGGISRLYCRDANAVIVVADVTRNSTIVQSDRWLSLINENVHHPDGSPIPVVLCLNKSDLLSSEDVEKPSFEGRTRTFKKCFFTSAKTGKNVTEALVELVEEVMTRNREMMGREKTRDRKMLKEIRKEDSQHSDCPC